MVSRKLQISLLVSFVFHFLCISFVSITFLSSGYKMNRYCSVNFFGSILSRLEPIEQFKKKDMVKLPAEADIQRKIAPFSQKPDVSLRLKKQTLNPDEFVDIDMPKVEPPSFASLSSARPAQEREVIFKPPLPEYPEWRQPGGRGASAIFKIYISADGLVEQSICMQGSGNPEIDAALARYIRRWRFAPALGANFALQTVKINLDWQ